MANLQPPMLCATGRQARRGARGELPCSLDFSAPPKASSLQHKPELFDSEHPLFLPYTSGTTGRPKGILPTAGGCLTQASYGHVAYFSAGWFLGVVATLL